MAIKDIVRMLPEIGQIKIGFNAGFKQTKNGKMMPTPTKTDYFQIFRMQRNSNGTPVVDHEATNEFDSEGKPRRIKIWLLSDDPDINFFTSYMYYFRGKLVCRGDGETAERRVINKNDATVSAQFYPLSKDGTSLIKEGKPTEEDVKGSCNRKTCPFALNRSCKPHGILMCLLRRATTVPNLGGTYKFRTSSFYTVTGMMGSLQALHDTLGGILKDIPLELVLTTRTVNTADGPRRTIHVAHVEIDSSLNMAQGDHLRLAADTSALRKNAMAEISSSRQLLEDLTDREFRHTNATQDMEVAAEFSPETTVIDPKKPMQYVDDKGNPINPNGKITDTPQPTRAEVANKPVTLAKLEEEGPRDDETPDEPAPEPKPKKPAAKPKPKTKAKPSVKDKPKAKPSTAKPVPDKGGAAPVRDRAVQPAPKKRDQNPAEHAPSKPKKLIDPAVPSERKNNDQQLQF